VTTNIFKIMLLLILLPYVILPDIVLAEQDEDIYFYLYKSNIPNVSTKMLFPDFWINNTNNPKNLLYNENDIVAYNRSNIENCPVVVDLEYYKEYFSKAEIVNMISAVSKPSKNKRYDANGRQYTPKDYDKLNNNLNFNFLDEINKIIYGFSVRRTEMRTYPTYERLFSSPDSTEYDRFMETAVYLAEPLIILSISKDQQWYFAQMYNYRAWIPVKDVAIAEKKEFMQFIKSKPFLIVTDKNIYTNYNPANEKVSEIKVDMGVKLPLAFQDEINDYTGAQSTSGNFVVKLPTRDEAGKLVIYMALIPITKDVHVGYLPYTIENIIKQSFKLQGERYGWGGTHNGRDCSSFLMDIFRTMGIKLPRNSSEQGKLASGIYYEMSEDMTLDERETILDKLDIGAGLFMSGHAMLYLGKYHNTYYAIHDFSGFHKKKQNGQFDYYSVLEVAVAPLSIYTSKESTFLEALYGARLFYLNR